MIAMRVLTCMVAVALSAGAVEASHRKEQPRKHCVVYHLTDGGVDKARAVLGNIVNHVELVVHGAALKSFVTKDMDPALRGALDRLQTQGLALGACGNTMKAGYAYVRP